MVGWRRADAAAARLKAAARAASCQAAFQVCPGGGGVALPAPISVTIERVEEAG